MGDGKEVTNDRNAAKQTGSVKMPLSSSLASGEYPIIVLGENKMYMQKILIQ
jgi:hypothetical protein